MQQLPALLTDDRAEAGWTGAAGGDETGEQVCSVHTWHPDGAATKWPLLRPLTVNPASRPEHLAACADHDLPPSGTTRLSNPAHQ